MPEQTATERSKAIDLALSQIEKQFGKGAIMRLGTKDPLVPVEVIPTGAISFDSALGVGGFPRGRVVEVFGPEASGKTTIALHVVAEAQKRGGMAPKINIDETALLSPAPDRSILALDEALTAFSRLAPRQAKVVELRYFGGLTEEEIVAALDISPRTVRRDWDLAKAWLLGELNR